MQAALVVVALIPLGVKDVRTVEWKGKEFTSKLTIERGGPPEAGYLAISFVTKTDSNSWTSSLRVSHSNEFWNEWKLALPVRVKGDDNPQVLAKRYRPNWLDFQLYHVDDDQITKAFSFSCRSERAIEWNVSGGRLVSFESFDRFEPRRDGVAERPGYRWQLHEWWQFNKSIGRWISTRKRWEEYKFDSDADAPGRALEKETDCNFMFR